MKLSPRATRLLTLLTITDIVPPDAKTASALHELADYIIVTFDLDAFADIEVFSANSVESSEENLNRQAAIEVFGTDDYADFPPYAGDD